MKTLTLLAALCTFVIFDECPRCVGRGMIVRWWGNFPYVAPCNRCGTLKVSPIDPPRPATEVGL